MGEGGAEEQHQNNPESSSTAADVTPGLDKELRRKILEDPETTLPRLSFPQIIGGLVYLKLSIQSTDNSFGDTTEQDIQKRLAPVASAITQYRTSQEAETNGEKWDKSLVDAFNQSLVKEGIIPKPKEKKAIKQTTASKEATALEDTVSRIVEDAVGEDYDEGREEREREEKEYRELLLKDPLATLKQATLEDVREGIGIVDKQLQKDGVRLEERQRRIQELAQEIIAYKTGKHVQEGHEGWDRSTGLYFRTSLSQDGLTPLGFHPKAGEKIRASLSDFPGSVLANVLGSKK